MNDCFMKHSQTLIWSHYRHYYEPIIRLTFAHWSLLRRGYLAIDTSNHDDLIGGPAMNAVAQRSSLGHRSWVSFPHPFWYQIFLGRFWPDQNTQTRYVLKNIRRVVLTMVFSLSCQGLFDCIIVLVDPFLVQILRIVRTKVSQTHGT